MGKTGSFEALVDRIGFMQGRLSPIINGRIQAFPLDFWEKEFESAKSLGIKQMEWTLDHLGLRNNPLMSEPGRSKINSLCKLFDVAVPSITGDCFMQAPFWKEEASKRDALLLELVSVIEASALLGTNIIVVPLVDNGRPETLYQAEVLVTVFTEFTELINRLGVKILFECDSAPEEVLSFIDRFSETAFGINYDIGNSASLQFDPSEEIRTYGHRILNVHVKDRIINGGTVPLGLGNANFDLVLSSLSKIKYQGKFILQTARSNEGKHQEVLGLYFDFLKNLLSKYYD